MWKRLVEWSKGYVEIELYGHMPERFINLCRNKNILLWDVSAKNGRYRGKMLLNDYWNIRKIAKKTHTIPMIYGRRGFPFMEKRIWNRKGMILGFITGISIVYLLSLRVWNISFDGQSLYTEERLLEYLKTIQVQVGMKTKEVDCQKIEEKIRLEYKDIGWVSAELSGTKLHIAMVETNMPVPYEKKEGGYHLIASHNGTVKKIITRAGTPRVNVGDEVKKGDILIAGIIEYRDDSDSIVKKEKLCADGDIILETVYSYKDSCKISYTGKKYTGSQKKILEIKVGSNNFFLTNPFNPFNTQKKYDIIANEQNLSLTKSFCIPISYKTKVMREYEDVQKRYTKEQGKDVLNSRFKEYISKIKENGAVIIENRVKFLIEKGEYLAQGKLVVTEPAREYQRVDESEWRMEESNEFNGAND
ncbi:MAG: sporulation protein YqfD [Lachnospiraceae bacterium]|nr:sporulation protein YqfD [Lachnospiraceae bacterium]